MKNLAITTTEEFKENYTYYGYEEFVKKVLQKCANKKELGLVGNIVLFDAEVSKRVYFKNETEQEFTIRYFIQECNEKKWKASYTLYVDVKNEDGSGHGEEISCGYAISHYVVDCNCNICNFTRNNIDFKFKQGEAINEN